MVVAATAATSITVPAPDIQRATFRVVGTSPLICHAWSEKAKRQMLDKQMKKAAPAKAAKDPHQDFLDSLYPLPDGSGYGFPSIGFKAAMVRAGTYLDIKMTFLRGAFHINGIMGNGEDLVRLTGSPDLGTGDPEMREDMVRIAMGTADIRYRGQFFPWEAEVPVKFNARVISHEQLANLLVNAGFSVGVGEWRPEKDGSYGMWELA